MTVTSEKQLNKPESTEATSSAQASASSGEATKAPFVPKRWPIFVWSLFWVCWIGFLFVMMVTRTRSDLSL